MGRMRRGKPIEIPLSRLLVQQTRAAEKLEQYMSGLTQLVLEHGGTVTMPFAGLATIKFDDATKASTFLAAQKEYDARFVGGE